MIGLGLSNQHTIIVFALPLTLAVLSRGHHQLLQPAVVGGLVVSGLAGLSPYLWLWCTSGQPVKYGWGDLSTAAGFFRHLTRAEYGTFQLVPLLLLSPPPLLTICRCCCCRRRCC